MNSTDTLGQELLHWQSASFPQGKRIEGSYCAVEKLDVEKHGKDLFLANSIDKEGVIWRYLPYGPFATLEEYIDWLGCMVESKDPLFYAIIDLQSGKAVGVASYLNINPVMGTIEVGHICYSPLLSRTIMATESMYLFMKFAFETGYRRYEWKCNALNLASRSAAKRLGFSYEGVFRQHMIVKGKNRDTAWFACIDSEWSELRQAFEIWLQPSNFHESGEQRKRLSELTFQAINA